MPKFVFVGETAAVYPSFLGTDPDGNVTTLNVEPGQVVELPTGLELPGFKKAAAKAVADVVARPAEPEPQPEPEPSDAAPAADPQE